MSTENGRQSPGYFLKKNLNKFAGKNVKYIKVSANTLREMSSASFSKRQIEDFIDISSGANEFQEASAESPIALSVKKELTEKALRSNEAIEECT